MIKPVFDKRGQIMPCGHRAFEKDSIYECTKCVNEWKQRAEAFGKLSDLMPLAKIEGFIVVLENAQRDTGIYLMPMINDLRQAKELMREGLGLQP